MTIRTTEESQSRPTRLILPVAMAVMGVAAVAAGLAGEWCVPFAAVYFSMLLLGGVIAVFQRLRPSRDRRGLLSVLVLLPHGVVLVWLTGGPDSPLWPVFFIGPLTSAITSARLSHFHAWMSPVALVGVTLAHRYLAGVPVSSVDIATLVIRLATIFGTLVAVKRVVRELRQAEANARVATRAKATFLANMSHELRTPVAGIIGLGELARCSDNPDERAQHLRLIESSAEHLLGVVNDVLDLSRIEAKGLTLESVPEDVGHIVESVRVLLQPQAQQKGITLRTSVSLDHPWRRVDPLRLRQVLLNLLGNAIKFTERGHAELWVDDGPGGVRFVIADSGIGMTREQVNRAFLPFQQAEASTSRRFGGTGLGLTISQQLLQLWDSSLQVQSEVGKGTRMAFTLDLPLASAPAANVPRATGVARGRRVLVAEDNPVNQLVVRRLLEDLGCTVVLVANGQEAVEVAFDGFDLVLMDVSMPLMDGLEATRAIREKEAALGLPRLPVVALTANTLPDDAELCRKAGMDRFVSKPLRRAILNEILVELALPEPELAASR